MENTIYNKYLFEGEEEVKKVLRAKDFEKIWYMLLLSGSNQNQFGDLMIEIQFFILPLKRTQ